MRNVCTLKKHRCFCLDGSLSATVCQSIGLFQYQLLT